MRLAIAMLVLVSALAASTLQCVPRSRRRFRHRRSNRGLRSLQSGSKRGPVRGRSGSNSGETRSRGDFHNNQHLGPQEASRASCLARGGMPG